MSDNEEVYEQFKEVKWMEWCEDVMMDEERTLKRLQKLQTTSADLPKEKVDLFAMQYQQYSVFKTVVLFRNLLPFSLQVLSKIRKYLQLIGRRVDQVVFAHEREPHKQDRKFNGFLVYFVSTYCHLCQPGIL